MRPRLRVATAVAGCALASLALAQPAPAPAPAPKGAAAEAPAPKGAAAASGNAAFPTDIRIGVIHTERILRDSPPAKAALTRIEHDFKPRDEELAGREQALRADAAKYEQEKAGLGEDERARRERDLEARGRDLTRQRQQFTEDLRARQFDELKKLKERLDQVLTRLAHDEHYDLILQDALWVGKRVDITDQVIKALGS